MVVILEPNELKSEAIPSLDPSDPPPGYSQVASQSDLTSTQAPRPLPDIRPTNLLSLSRPNSSISGKWIIEPALFIPPTQLPPLSHNETRKNLFLESHNGSVDAEIFIMPNNDEAPRRVPQRNRIFIETLSKNGSVTTVMHDVPSTNPNKIRLPMSIHSSSVNGRVTLYLPRSFQGPATFKTGNGSVRLSDAMKASETQLSNVDHTQRSFIGRFDPPEWMHDAKWTGDELYVEAINGSIDVHFDDEADPSKSSSPGFFGRMYQEFSRFA